MKLEYIIGDATRPTYKKVGWILNGCNNLGAWGSGFVIALNKTFGTGPDSPMKKYEKWIEDGATIGDIDIVRIAEENLYVVNMITQKGCGSSYYFKQEIPLPPARLDFIEECLWRVRLAGNAFNKKYGFYPEIISPKVGCGLGGLVWNGSVEILYEEILGNSPMDVTIYTLE